MEDDIEEGTVHVQPTIVVYEAQFADLLSTNSFSLLQRLWVDGFFGFLILELLIRPTLR